MFHTILSSLFIRFQAAVTSAPRPRRLHTNHFKMSFPYFLVKLHYNNFEQLNKAVNCDFKLTTFVFDPLYSNLNLNSMCCVLLDLARVSNICFDFRLVFTLVRYYFTTLRSNAHTQSSSRPSRPSSSVN